MGFAPAKPPTTSYSKSLPDHHPHPLLSVFRSNAESKAK